MKTTARIFFVTLLAALAAAPAARTAEPNNDFASATGPLTAGQVLKASLETADDADYQFFYIPDFTELTVKLTNTTPKKDATGGRTLVTSLLQARKGKLPLPIPATVRKAAPGKKVTIKLMLGPGKYFVPVGHASATNGAADVPFRLQITPAGVTTDSYEIFARRCKDQQRKVSRVKSSKKNAAERVAKAKRKNKSDTEIRFLKRKLKSKRAKVKDAQKLKRALCSVPQ